MASSGWWQKFVDRFDLGNYIMCGEKASADYPAKKEFTASFTKFMIHWSPNTVTEIILNFDEFGLQYKSVPKRSYMTKQEPCLAKKPIRTRVSLFVGTTMSGYKFKPVVIVKAK